MVIGIIVSVTVGIVVGIVLTRVTNDYDVILDKTIHDKLLELPPIYAGARRSIKIATDFDARFFDEQRVKDAIENAIENGAKVMFLSEKEPLEWYKDKSGVVIKQVESLARHIMIIDENHVRLERSHEPLTFGDKKDHIALIFKGFPQLGEQLNLEFDELWASA